MLTLDKHGCLHRRLLCLVPGNWPQGSAFFACANRYNCTVLRMKITNLRKGLSGGIRDR